MLRHVPEPVDAGGFELGVRVEAGGAGGVGREAAGDRARDERGALLLQPFDQRPLLRHQGVDLRCFVVEEVGNDALISNRWQGHANVCAELRWDALLPSGAIHLALAGASKDPRDCEVEQKPAVHPGARAKDVKLGGSKCGAIHKARR
jgi:hypothetical protein